MHSDGAARVLSGILRLLPPDRREWGAAMWGELAHVEGIGARWRFTWGCLVAVLRSPNQLHSSGRRVLRLIVVGAVGSGLLVTWAFVRYPGLRTGPRTWLALLVFLGVLVGYLAIGRLVMTVTPRDGTSSRLALLTAAVTAGWWLLVVAAAILPPVMHGALVALTGIVLTPVVAGMLAARRTHSQTAARGSVLLTGLMSGLMVFLVWVGQTLVTGGRPYDVGQVRDFHTSSAPDLATYAVNDNLGSAMVMLVLVPLVVTCLGVLGTVAGRSRQAEPTA
jgi:hypothetical protein